MPCRCTTDCSCLRSEHANFDGFCNDTKANKIVAADVLHSNTISRVINVFGLHWAMKSTIQYKRMTSQVETSRSAHIFRRNAYARNETKTQSLNKFINLKIKITDESICKWEQKWNVSVTYFMAYNRWCTWKMLNIMRSSWHSVDFKTYKRIFERIVNDWINRVKASKIGVETATVMPFDLCLLNNAEHGELSFCFAFDAQIPASKTHRWNF